MPFTMREAVKGDSGTLGSLMSELTGRDITDEQMEKRLDDMESCPIDELYICEENGSPVGVLGFRIRENIEDTTRFGEVSVVVVDPSDRFRGAGRFMMDHAEKLAREHRCIGMWLVSGFGREEPAHAFYRKMGYEVNGYRFIKLFGDRP